VWLEEQKDLTRQIRSEAAECWSTVQLTGFLQFGTRPQNDASIQRLQDRVVSPTLRTRAEISRQLSFSSRAVCEIVPGDRSRDNQSSDVRSSRLVPRAAFDAWRTTPRSAGWEVAGPDQTLLDRATKCEGRGGDFRMPTSQEPAAKAFSHFPFCFRASLIKALSLRVPSMSQQRAELCANVILQTVRGMMRVYNHADLSQRAIVSREFKTALSAYLKTVFIVIATTD
jgi:hypothetical protein